MELIYNITTSSVNISGATTKHQYPMNHIISALKPKM